MELFGGHEIATRTYVLIFVVFALVFYAALWPVGERQQPLLWSVVFWGAALAWHFWRIADSRAELSERQIYEEWVGARYSDPPYSRRRISKVVASGLFLWGAANIVLALLLNRS